VDEDSWQILLIDQYDNPISCGGSPQGHAMNFYNVPTTWTAAETHTDLQAGRYLVMGLFNEGRVARLQHQRPRRLHPMPLRQEGVPVIVSLRTGWVRPAVATRPAAPRGG